MMSQGILAMRSSFVAFGGIGRSASATSPSVYLAGTEFFHQTHQGPLLFIQLKIHTCLLAREIALAPYARALRSAVARTAPTCFFLQIERYYATRVPVSDNRRESRRVYGLYEENGPNRTLVLQRYDAVTTIYRYQFIQSIDSGSFCCYSLSFMNREATDISISSRKDRDHLMGVAAIFEEDFSIDWLEELTELKTSLILVVVEGEAENGVLIKKAPAIYAFANDGQRTACLSVLSSDEIERYHRLMR